MSMFGVALVLASQLGAVSENAPSRETEFVVVDAVTHEPIERFGVRITETGTRRASSEVDALDEAIVSSAVRHVGGLFVCNALPGDQLRLIAPGHVPFEIVCIDDGPSGRTKIELVPGSMLTGRATLRGAVVPSARLRLYDESLVRTWEEDMPGIAFDEDSHFWSNDFGQDDPYGLTLPISNRAIGAQGFTIERLAAGAHRLVIETDGGDRRVLDPLEIPLGGTVDLGEIALDPAGRIEGHATLPGGASAADWSVEDSYLDRYRSAELDATGGFALERLTPAVHHLLFVSKSSDPPQRTLRSLRVAPGATANIDVDLTTPPRCRVALAVSIGTTPAEGVRVGLRGTSLESASCDLGPTDVAGQVAGWSRALGRVRATFASDLGLPLGCVAFEKRMCDGDVLTRTIVLPAASLDIAWHADPPFDSLAQLWLIGFERQRRSGAFRVDIDVARTSSDSLRAAIADSHCGFGPIAPGDYDLTLKLFSTHGDFAAFRKRVLVPAVPDFTCEFGELERVP